MESNMPKREEIIAKAAKLLGIPRATIYQAVGRGEIKHRELELGTVLIDLNDAERWKERKKNTEGQRGRPVEWA